MEKRATLLSKTADPAAHALKSIMQMKCEGLTYGLPIVLFSLRALRCWWFGLLKQHVVNAPLSSEVFMITVISHETLKSRTWSDIYSLYLHHCFATASTVPGVGQTTFVLEILGCTPKKRGFSGAESWRSMCLLLFWFNANDHMPLLQVS